MENPTKETVIIVHGTWAAPKDDQPDQICWYQIPAEGQNKPNFVSKLNKALERRGSPARCWAHCKDNSEIFSWTGENDWIDRTRAGSRLAAEINKLQADGWKCHVVAHSHGGNVIAEALPAVVPTGDQGYGLTGTITTLGSPFIDIMSPIANQTARWHKIWSIVTLSIFFLQSAWAPMYHVIIGRYDLLGTVLPTMLFVLVFLCYQLWKADWSIEQVSSELLLGKRSRSAAVELHFRQKSWTEYWKDLGGQDFLHPMMLCVSSKMDEAWQILHQVRAIPNLLAPKLGLVAYILASRRTYILRSCEIARTRGVALFPDQTGRVKTAVVTIWIVTVLLSTLALTSTPTTDYTMNMIIATAPPVFLIMSVFFGVQYFGSFYSAFLAPLRGLARQGRAISRTMSYDFGTYFARRRGWALLQEIAFGLQAYGFQLPKAEMVPTFAPSAIYKSEELPEGALQRALAKREEWLRRNFGEVAKTFSELVVAASDLSSLQKKVETDLSLVHTAYYTDDECIERIADWIAGRARRAEFEGACPCE